MSRAFSYLTPNITYYETHFLFYGDIVSFIIVPALSDADD